MQKAKGDQSNQLQKFPAQIYLLKLVNLKLLDALSSSWVWENFWKLGAILTFNYKLTLD